MRSRYYVREKEYAHFVTSSVLEWLPVFTTPACCNILVEALDFCRQHKGLKLYAWVILDNHFHAVVHAAELPRAIADLKKFTTRNLLAQLKTERRDWLLDLLSKHQAAHKVRSRHQLWQEGYHPQAIYSDKTMLQKIEYIHANPVRRGWVTSPEHWRYSSAHEWLPGTQPLLTCDEWK